ncbi:MAG: hypothetical protein ACE14P_00670 [Methanotrichaceae archaeon]
MRIQTNYLRDVALARLLGAVTAPSNKFGGIHGFSTNATRRSRFYAADFLP